jgi:RNA polymerase primary sigma factor
VVDKIAQMRRISAQLSNDLGHEPTEGELSEELCIAAEELARLKRVGLRRESLDAFVGGDDMTEFGENVPDEQAQTVVPIAPQVTFLRSGLPTSQDAESA